MPGWRSRHTVRGRTALSVQEVRADREDQGYQALPEHLQIQEDRLFHIRAYLQDLWCKYDLSRRLSLQHVYKEIFE